MPQHQPQPESNKHEFPNGLVNAASKFIGLPEGGRKSGASWEVGELGADAGEEKAGQAVAVDGRDARRRNPPDQTEPDHIQVSSKPISLEASKDQAFIHQFSQVIYIC